MKKNVLIAGLVLSAGMTASAQVAHAEDTYTSKTTNGNVTITSGSNEITPKPPTPSPATGPYMPVTDLGIASATNLYFDDIELSSEPTTREALYLNNTTPITNALAENGEFTTAVPTDSSTVYTPGYSVSDRRGTGAGWNLTMQLGTFTETNVAEGKTAHTLRGATLTFPVVTPITVATSTATADEAPTTNSVTFNAGGSSAVLMNAKVGQGKGLWEARYNSRALAYSDGSTATKAPITLYVPGDNYKGTYQANLNWTLADSPATVAPTA